MRKRTNHGSLMPKREGSSRAQKIAIPKRIIKQAGTAASAIGATKTRSARPPARIDWILWNHGVCTKAKMSPMHTTTHDEYENTVRALLERNHLDIVVLPLERLGTHRSVVVQITSRNHLGAQAARGTLNYGPNYALVLGDVSKRHI